MTTHGGCSTLKKEHFVNLGNNLVLTQTTEETMKMLLTGATGTLGSAVLEKISSNGQLYCLIRNKHGDDAGNRLGENGRAIVIPGDITLPLCGVSAENIELLKGVDVVLHCAASIDFGLSRAITTSNININGTRNILELSLKAAAKKFIHVSTSYVAGGAEFFSEDDHDIGQQLRNPYEKSKSQGEEMVRIFASKSNMPFAILRPSVIVGDSKTGKIMSFEGYYGFFKYLISLRDKVKKSSKKSVLSELVNGEKVFLPVTVRCSYTSTINLVPIDWVTNCICYFLKQGTMENRAYHLVNEDPPHVRQVIEKTLELVGVNCYLRETSEPLKNGFPKNIIKIAETMQKGFELTENLYWPYVTKEPKFSVKELKRIMGKDYSPAPQTDNKLLETLLSYAEKEKWGRKKGELTLP